MKRSYEVYKNRRYINGEFVNDQNNQPIDIQVLELIRMENIGEMFQTFITKANIKLEEIESNYRFKYEDIGGFYSTDVVTIFIYDIITRETENIIAFNPEDNYDIADKDSDIIISHPEINELNNTIDKINEEILKPDIEVNLQITNRINFTEMKNNLARLSEDNDIINSFISYISR